MKKGRGKEIFWGIMLLAGALFLLISRLGYFSFEGIGFMTIIFSFVVLSLLIHGIFEKSFGCILFSIAFFAILYAEQLNIEEITPWPVLGAALLGTIGLNIIFKKKRHFGVNIGGHRGSKWEDGDDGKWLDITTIHEENSEGRVQYDVSFGSAVKYVNVANFTDGEIDCSFGSLSVYFDNATLKDGRAILKVDNSFGQTEIFIPKEWKVEFDIDNGFGGTNEHGVCQWDGNSILYIRGSVSFGSLDVHYI